MNRLRVEMVVPFLDVAGLEMVVVSLVRTMSSMGHDVGVTCIERPGPLGEQLKAAGHRVTVVPTPGVWTNLMPTALASWFRESRPDVVHVHSGAWLKAVQAARIARVPRSVYTLHGIWPQPAWFIPLYSNLAARVTGHIVAVSQSLREHLIRAFHVPGRKISVIQNGIDTQHFSPAPRTGWLRTELGLDRDVAMIGTVARLHPVKNHALLVDAFAQVHRSCPDTALVIVGDGPLRAQLEQQIRDRGLERAAFLCGATSNVIDYYREFDVFALSSVLEGTSISALEAMSCGCCVVATAVGGNPGLLGDGRWGVLVPGSDASALAEALRGVVVNTQLREQLGRDARRRVLEHHDEAAVARAYLEVYAGGSSS